MRAGRAVVHGEEAGVVAWPVALVEGAVRQIGAV